VRRAAFAAGVACAQDKRSRRDASDRVRRWRQDVVAGRVYPTTSDGTAKPFFVPYFTNINLLADATPSFDGTKRPLIMFSHGRGSNVWFYAWFAQYLAERGFIVAAMNHYRANTYDSNIAYLSNRLWQRPVDIRLAISFLLKDPAWARMIDADRIGVAGHSQGGFTSLWLGGAKVSAEGYLAFQRGWRNNQMLPEHLRRELPLDPGPALDVRDPRIKAAFAMAPGIIKAFGMDEAGLRAMAIPSYVTVGARDTQTPPGPNAEFAAANAGTPSSRSCPVWWITRFSRTNATRRVAKNFPEGASMRRPWTAPPSTKPSARRRSGSFVQNWDTDPVNRGPAVALYARRGCPEVARS
jgi:predicted dienelactone hydrolase